MSEAENAVDGRRPRRRRRPDSAVKREALTVRIAAIRIGHQIELLIDADPQPHGRVPFDLAVATQDQSEVERGPPVRGRARLDHQDSGPRLTYGIRQVIGVAVCGRQEAEVFCREVHALLQRTWHKGSGLFRSVTQHRAEGLDRFVGARVAGAAFVVLILH